MSLTFNSKTYVNDVARGSDSFRYFGALNTASFKDIVDVYRTSAAKAEPGTTNYKGRFKLTRGCTNGTVALANDIIIDMVVNVPTSTASAEVDSAINDAAAFAAVAAFKAVVKEGKINQ